MFFFAIAIVLIVSFLYFIKGMSSPDPKQVENSYKKVLIVLGFVFIILFFRAGMPALAVLLGGVMAAIPNITKIIRFLFTIKMVKDLLKKYNIKYTLPKENGGMTKKRACEILDVAEDATEKQVEDAYKRLIKKNHPDAGGSKYLAGEINKARDFLLKKK